MSKYPVGSKVALNDRTPQHIDLARDRPRTVVGVRYDADKKACYYRLGSNSKGSNRDGDPQDGYPHEFRSYMLRPWKVMVKIGRPRMKRRYTRKYTGKSSVVQESPLTPLVNSGISVGSFGSLF